MATIDANLVGEIVSNSFLMGFNDTLAPISVFSTDFEDANADPHDTINVPVYDANTGAQDFNKATENYEDSSGGAISNIQVVIDKHKKKTIDLDDVQIANSKAAVLERLGRQAGQGLAQAVFQDILSVVTNANYGAAGFVGASTAFDVDEVVAIKDAADGKNMPKMERGLLLTDAYYNALLTDTKVTDTSAYGSDEGIIAGMIPNLMGFRTYQTPAIPANGENLVGLAATPTAIATAIRYLQPQDQGSAYIATRRLVHPETGIVLGMREHYDAASGVRFMNFECNYGYAVGQDAIIRMTSV